MIGAILVRHRKPTLRAIQWTGHNEAEVEALVVNFEALAEPVDEDPDATAQLLTAPHSVWTLMYDGDWCVEEGFGWKRVPAGEFAETFEVVAEETVTFDPVVLLGAPFGAWRQVSPDLEVCLLAGDRVGTLRVRRAVTS